MLLSNKKGGLNMRKITLDVKELCGLLGISQTTVYAMVRQNEVPHFKVRGKILFNRQVVEAWTRGESPEQIKEEVQA
jgi:excisionase family DNA binding protein